ncbi:hypothetical protein RRG08_052668 [Elysia crispata]|uniref:Cytochrome P450 n=1 Tax=Elysia crispata TaxID=231223 RepID=A0AAE1AQD5_9GAST|nr:hypothetical protein RRG08_052668 [Elysia crispata]
MRLSHSSTSSVYMYYLDMTLVLALGRHLPTPSGREAWVSEMMPRPGHQSVLQLLLFPVKPLASSNNVETSRRSQHPRPLHLGVDQNLQIRWGFRNHTDLILTPNQLLSGNQTSVLNFMLFHMKSDTPERLETWSSQILAYLALTLGLVVLVKYLLTHRVLANIPPFPARPYPVLGHLPYLMHGLRDQLNTWTEATGELFSLYFGSNLVVILNSYDVYHKAFVKHGDTLSDRPKSLAADIGGGDHNKGILHASGQVWKEQRTVCLHILRSFGMGKNSLASKVSQEVSTYLDALSQLSGHPSDVRTLTRTAIANIICSIVVGQRFEYDDPYFVKFVQNLDELFRLGQSSSLVTLFPWLRYIPGDVFKAKERTDRNQYILNEFCHHHIEKTKTQGVDEEGESFISAYLQEKQRLEDQGQTTSLDEENLARNMYGLLVGGTETGSTALSWFMLYMLHFPAVQAKIFAEISDVIGLSRFPDMRDKSKMNFTNAAILESQRFSITPFNIPHQCREDTTINGYTIPAGTTVIPNSESIFRSSDTWGDPKQFRPGRFLDAQGVFNQSDRFTAFGIGRRACPGESLAKTELFLFITSLIQRFELLPAAPGDLPSLAPVEGIVFSPQPFQIRFVDRRSL